MLKTLSYFKGDSPVILTPILRAVPATMLIADSIVKQFKSFILSSAILRTVSQLIDPTFERLGSLDPFAILAASNTEAATGEALTMKSND